MENEQFLNDLNKSSNSSNTSSNNSIIEETDELSEQKPTNSARFSLVEELINSSEDEKVYEKKKYLESPVKNDIINPADHTTHNCTYFEIQDSQKTPEKKCEHTESFTQAGCIKCDNKIERKDSLDFMAFLTPLKEEAKGENWNGLLKFDSPTVIQENDPIEVFEATKDQSACEGPCDQSMTIIDTTITEDTSNLS